MSQENTAPFVVAGSAPFAMPAVAGDERSA
jgi:hypothetical protein